MEKNDTEAQDCFFGELTIRLRQSGYQVMPMEDGALPVRGTRVSGPVCKVTSSGGILYREPDRLQDVMAQERDKVMTIAGTVAEYMRLMEAAPLLVAKGLEGDYRLLADFNGSVLAGHLTQYGAQFVTWDWDYDRKGVHQGNYFGGEYRRAKQDFALRSGLVRKDFLLSPEQMTEVYRSVHETLEAQYPITEERAKLLTSVARQVERAVPDLEERVRHSNQLELETGQQNMGQMMM